MVIKGWRCGGGGGEAGNAFIKLSLPIDGCLCPEARPLPYALNTFTPKTPLLNKKLLPSFRFFTPTPDVLNAHDSQDLLHDLNLLQPQYL